MEEKQAPSQRRQIAYKVRIKDILQGQYFQQEGWNPNYLLTSQQKKISRINLIAVVVSQNQDQTHNFILDDGTGQVTLRMFEPPKKNIQVGDTLLTISKIREFNNQRYLFPEIIKKITNPKWVEVRKLELMNQSPPTTDPPPKKHSPESSEAPYENVLNLIKKIDQGDGADVDQIISQSTLPDCEHLIENLLKEGDIFEISPGRIKILK